MQDICFSSITLSFCKYEFGICISFVETLFPKITFISCKLTKHQSQDYCSKAHILRRISCENHRSYRSRSSLSKQPKGPVVNLAFTDLLQLFLIHLQDLVNRRCVFRRLVESIVPRETGKTDCKPASFTNRIPSTGVNRT